MIINNVEYREVPVNTTSCIGCGLYDGRANRGLGNCTQPHVECLGLNRKDGQDVQFKVVKHA